MTAVRDELAVMHAALDEYAERHQADLPNVAVIAVRLRDEMWEAMKDAPVQNVDSKGESK